MLTIVTRHKGAVEWLQRQGICGDVRVELTAADIEILPRDAIVLGVLPLHLAVAVVQSGRRFIAIQIDGAPRGVELTANDMQRVAFLLELQLEWRQLGGDWRSDKCRNGVPEAMVGDCQEFRIGMVPRTATDISAVDDPLGVPPEDLRAWVRENRDDT